MKFLATEFYLGGVDALLSVLSNRLDVFGDLVAFLETDDHIVDDSHFLSGPTLN